MEHKVWYDDELKVVRLDMVGIFSTEDARFMGKKFIELLEGKPYRQVVIDLKAFKNMENRETRSVSSEVLNQAGITHVAAIGANATARMIAKILLKLGTMKSDLELFGTFESGVKWIEKNR